MKPSSPDIMSYLLKPLNNQTPTGLDYMLLQGDSQLIVVAGRWVTWLHRASESNFIL